MPVVIPGTLSSQMVAIYVNCVLILTMCRMNEWILNEPGFSCSFPSSPLWENLMKALHPLLRKLFACDLGETLGMMGMFVGFIHIPEFTELYLNLCTLFYINSTSIKSFKFLKNRSLGSISY